eukprot:465956_1
MGTKLKGVIKKQTQVTKKDKKTHGLEPFVETRFVEYSCKTYTGIVYHNKSIDTIGKQECKKEKKPDRRKRIRQSLKINRSKYHAITSAFYNDLKAIPVRISKYFQSHLAFYFYGVYFSHKMVNFLSTFVREMKKVEDDVTLIPSTLTPYFPQLVQIKFIPNEDLYINNLKMNNLYITRIIPDLCRYCALGFIRGRMIKCDRCECYIHIDCIKPHACGFDVKRYRTFVCIPCLNELDEQDDQTDTNTESDTDNETDDDPPQNDEKQDENEMDIDEHEEDEEDDDDDEEDDDDVLHEHESRKQSTQSQCIPPTPRPSNNHKKKRHHSTHNIQSNVMITSDETTQKGKTINIIQPQKHNPKARFLFANTVSSSLLDDEDKYDPPQASIRVSVSAPTKNKEKSKVHGLAVTKVPRNSQYPSYATALQSVVEEATESVEQHTHKSKQSDASKEYHQYKKRQQAFHQIINKNKEQIKHNASSMNMNVNININNDNSMQNRNTNNANHLNVNNNNTMHTNPHNKRRFKRKSKKKTYGHKMGKSKSSGSTSLVITKNKKKRSNVDIRRPQTTRRIRVSSPTLNYKPKRPLNYKHKQDIGGVFRYELASDDTSDVLSDTTFASTSSVSNDTTANLNESDARATGFGISSAQRSSSVNVSAMHANRYMNQKRHYPRRPVTIIRRAVPNKNNKRMNPMMRASSAMFTPTNRHSFSPNQNPYTHNKIGLFDGDSLMTSQLGATPRFRADVKDSAASGWEFLERDRFFLESKYKSHTGSETSFDEDKLSVDTNYNHDLCKKEVHDAYERGFLAGYFLGVNIMQQQLKEKDNPAIAK